MNFLQRFLSFLVLTQRKTAKIVFVAFLAHAFQTFDPATETLTISAASEFTTEYKDVTKRVVIDGEVTEIPSQAFQNWGTLISANIGDSVASIESYAFYEFYNKK